MNELIEFWKDMDFEKEPYIHPEDKIVFGEKSSDYSINEKTYMDDLGNTKHKNKIVSSLYPVPYNGDLENAKIYILLMNPGYALSEFKIESEFTEIRDEIKNNIRQKNLNKEFPFWALNPEYAYHGGFDYWHKRFNKIILEIKEKKNMNNYKEAMSFVSKNIAVLELIPYHSANRPKIMNYIELPSRDIIKNIVKNNAENEKEKLFVVMRAKDEWGLEVGGNVIANENRNNNNLVRNAYFADATKEIMYEVLDI